MIVFILADSFTYAMGEKGDLLHWDVIQAEFEARERELLLLRLWCRHISIIAGHH